MSVEIDLENSELVLENNTSESHRILSSQERTILVRYAGEEKLKIIVPRTVFNPYQNVVCSAFLEKVFTEVISVTGKKIVDFGCGCGLLGLTSKFMGAEKIVYTDINPNAEAIRNHYLYDDKDAVVIDDLYESGPENSADMVFALIPGSVVDKELPADSYETSICRTKAFIPNMLRNIGKVLVPGGRLVSSYKFYSGQFNFFGEVIQQLARYDFDLTQFEIIWEQQEKGRTGVLFSVVKSL